MEDRDRAVVRHHIPSGGGRHKKTKGLKALTLPIRSAIFQVEVIGTK